MISSLNELRIERVFLCLEKGIHKNPTAIITRQERLGVVLLGHVK